MVATSEIKNKQKREDVYRELKRKKGKEKLERRMKRKELERVCDDPSVRKR
jgi:hypothetical protein